jgi:hypothetical protein
MRRTLRRVTHAAAPPRRRGRSPRLGASLQRSEQAEEEAAELRAGAHRLQERLGAAEGQAAVRAPRPALVALLMRMTMMGRRWRPRPRRRCSHAPRVSEGGRSAQSLARENQAGEARIAALVKRCAGPDVRARTPVSSTRPTAPLTAREALYRRGAGGRRGAARCAEWRRSSSTWRARAAKRRASARGAPRPRPPRWTRWTRSSRALPRARKARPRGGAASPRARARPSSRSTARALCVSRPAPRAPRRRAAATALHVRARTRARAHAPR